MRVNLETADIRVALGYIGFECIDEVNRSLDPWIGHVDVIIPGDGKFPQYPGKHDYSTDGWLDYVVDRYKNKCQVVPYKYAGDQIEKRQKYLDIAGELKCDYLIVVDTDEYLDPEYQDFDYFYSRLIKLSRLVDDRLFFQWEWIPSAVEWPKQGNRFPDNVWRLSQRIHKDPGTMRYCCNSHFTWCPKDVTDEQVYQWQIDRNRADQARGISTLDRGFMLDNPYIFSCRNVIDGVRIRMDRSLRSEEQIKGGAEWAFLNQHEERFGEYCAISKLMGQKVPEGFQSWDDYRAVKHSFNKETGKIILDKKE